VIESSSLVDRIVADLEDQIRQGKLLPLERLPSERSLCAVFSVGRTTVREALQTLAVRGYVTRTRRGAVVAEPPSSEQPAGDLAALAARATIRDLYEVRKLLEVRVARWAAIRATPADLERLRRAVEAEYCGLDDDDNPNTAFHEALVAAAHNPILSRIHASSHDIFYHLPFYWKFFDAQEVNAVRARRHALARRWHRLILQALEQRDPDEADGAMFQHLDIMEKDLIYRLRLVNGQLSNLDLQPHPLLEEPPNANGEAHSA
jgi:GntR family transcriptional regulator, transcriptional repressor for pyruvate dehydrogenase complex